MDRTPQTLAPPRKPRHHGADGHSQYTRRLLVREVLDPDQQKHRPLLLRQCRKAAQQIPMFEHGMLPAVDTRQFRLLRQRVVWVSPPQPMLIGPKPVVKVGVEPTLQI